MAKHSKYGNKYSSYHGRRATGKVVIALVLLAAIVASIAYLLWGDHGLSWAMFPRFDKEAVSQPEAPITPPEVELIIEDPAPAQEVEQVGGLLLREDATTWVAEDNADFDFLAVTMKDSTGTLYFPSSSSSMVAGAVSDLASGNGEPLGALLAEETHTVAFVSTLQDPKYATYYVTASALMSNRGYGYKDEHGSVWIDPGKEDAQQWVLSVVGDLVAMGFDEIVLTDFHYPLTGELDTLRYASDDPTQALTDLLAMVYAVTQEAGVSLGMEMASGALVSGSVPYEAWVDYVDTFYATANDLPTAQSLVGAGRIITLAEQVPTSGDYLLVP